MKCGPCVSSSLSPAARYQNELAGVDTELLAERFYYQALSVAPQIGKWSPARVPHPSSIFRRTTTLRWQVCHPDFTWVPCASSPS